MSCLTTIFKSGKVQVLHVSHYEQYMSSSFHHLLDKLFLVWITLVNKKQTYILILSHNLTSANICLKTWKFDLLTQLFNAGESRLYHTIF